MLFLKCEETNKSSIYPDKYLNFTSKISSECSHLLFVFWRPWYSKERRKRQNIFLKNLILTFCLKVGAYFWILFGAKVVSVNRVLWLVWGFFSILFFKFIFCRQNTPFNYRQVLLKTPTLVRISTDYQHDQICHKM